MSLYEIAFAGQIMPGAQAEQVKENLARLFQADAQRIALLFSGRRIVIKSNLDAAGAEKYRATLERAGAVAIVQALDAQIEEVELAPPPAPAAPAATSSRPGARVIPRDEYMAAFADVEAPDFDIAPVGSDLQEHKPDAQAPAVDLSQFSLAPVGSDMGQAKASPAAPAPDTSHLKLQE
ncbi:hypothetical protein LRS11_19290 [Pseudomonas sp. J452]|uniref:hypothetical protein n=1 Tax=Pseudomonas sp. J452 TaxID=2898441 RepID=UPI0021AE2FC9|nr:hypothetical protein [Pseudomonas sp. J452]UUY07928.1 hypothetical protein LRS11_19290 [Pseudomonas sp. J452]